ncbi:AMP-binding protein [Ideonella sp. B508-1]|uniref:AMP-binding protein n=1 Tax=Ideonella sp. B508-1 TaxID=137716 RepID=UPI000348820D|nr:AMP-binding protein [Ideonella sp. B508-1]
MQAQADLSLAHLIQRQASEAPDFPVLTFEGSGVRPDEVRTFAQLWDNGCRLAQVLLDLGVKPGDRFALLMANHPEFIEAMVAASVVGAAVVPIDPRTKGDKLAFMLNNAQCVGIFAADYVATVSMQMREACESLHWVLGFATDEGMLPLSDMPGVLNLHYAWPAARPELPILTTRADEALELIYTSGTTGDPKGIIMTHGRYCELARVSAALFSYRDTDVLYSGLSLTHANAQIVTVSAALGSRLRCVLSRRFTKSRLWDITRKYQATTFTLLGGMTTAVYAEPPKANDAEHPVRMVVSAGMPAAIWRDFERRFGVAILEFYGAAEGGLSFNHPGQGPVGSIGKPPAFLDHRIVDDDDQDVPVGAQGELIFRAKTGEPYQVAYHGQPEASAKKCLGGWLRMGDVVHADADGWLYFDFRKGGGIRRNGEFIQPAGLEKVIAELPCVDDVFVYGIAQPHNAAGEKCVVAAVVPRSDMAFSPAQVFGVCMQVLGPGQSPDIVQVLAAIPKTASEKPQERFLIEAFEREPRSLHRRGA